MTSFCRWDGTDLILRVQVQPRASRDEIVGIHGDTLKIRVTAPPVDGKANAHLIRFLAGQFGVTQQAITLQSGDSTRRKTFRIRAPHVLPAPVVRP